MGASVFLSYYHVLHRHCHAKDVMNISSGGLLALRQLHHSSEAVSVERRAGGSLVVRKRNVSEKCEGLSDWALAENRGRSNESPPCHTVCLEAIAYAGTISESPGSLASILNSILPRLE